VKQRIEALEQAPARRMARRDQLCKLNSGSAIDGSRAGMRMSASLQAPRSVATASVKETINVIGFAADS